MKSVQVLLNPQANRGSGARVKDKVHRALERAGVPHDLQETDGPGHATELTQRARQAGYEIVAAAGGDGTVSEVVNGLLRYADQQTTGSGVQDGTAGDVGTQKPHEHAGTLAVLPVGTGNDFAATLGHPADLDRAAQIIATGRTRTIDVGRVTVRAKEQEIIRYFANNVGFGLEAQVTVESTRISRLDGVWRYAAAALRAVMRYNTTHVDVTWETPDGERQTHEGELLLVSVGNGPRVGGGFYVTPDAKMDDGVFDVGIVQALSKLRILYLLPKTLSGSHTQESAFQMVRTPRVQIRCAAGRPIQADGEVLSECAEQTEIEIQPGRLGVLV